MTTTTMTLACLDCHSTCSLRLSNTNVLCTQFVCTSSGARSFSVAALIIWNSLSLSLRTCTSPVPVLAHSVVTSDPLLPAGLPLHLTHLFLCLRFVFQLTVVRVYNYIYLHTCSCAVLPLVSQVKVRCQIRADNLRVT